MSNLLKVVAQLDLEKHGASKGALLAFYICMMALAGASSLGFIGLALSRSVEQGCQRPNPTPKHTRPVPHTPPPRPVVGGGREWEVSEVYSAGAVEWFIQAPMARTLSP